MLVMSSVLPSESKLVAPLISTPLNAVPLESYRTSCSVLRSLELFAGSVVFPIISKMSMVGLFTIMTSSKVMIALLQQGYDCISHRYSTRVFRGLNPLPKAWDWLHLRTECTTWSVAACGKYSLHKDSQRIPSRSFEAPVLWSQSSCAEILLIDDIIWGDVHQCFFHLIPAEHPDGMDGLTAMWKVKQM